MNISPFRIFFLATLITVGHPCLFAATQTDTTSIINWLVQNQKFNETVRPAALPLVTSFPDDPSSIELYCSDRSCVALVFLNTQAFTDDQAIAGIALLKEGKVAEAGKIFNFYKSRWEDMSPGFHDIYDVQSDGLTVNNNKTTGNNAWIALFFMHYYAVTKDVSALQLAEKVAHWILGFQYVGAPTFPSDKDGGFVMGAGSLQKKIFVRDNFQIYALLKILSAKAETQGDRTLFASAISSPKGLIYFFKHQIKGGLFQRSPADSLMTKSLDSNTDAIAAFGFDGLKSNFGISAEQMILGMENAFAVQDNRVYGLNVLTAKGFDFSDITHAMRFSNPSVRLGLKWVAGTNQMIQTYKDLAAYSNAAGNLKKGLDYLNRAGHFLDRNADNVINEVTADASGNPLVLTAYTSTDAAATQIDVAGTQIWWDDPNGVSLQGRAAGSTAWVYLALKGINPFKL